MLFVWCLLTLEHGVRNGKPHPYTSVFLPPTINYSFKGMQALLNGCGTWVKNAGVNALDRQLLSYGYDGCVTRLVLLALQYLSQSMHILCPVTKAFFKFSFRYKEKWKAIKKEP
ncbi:hypothetical protein Tco_0275947 [Tanacetum coccineum]